jgi:acetylornithine deacetylase/succinyl-diaminopimelate desuccinylase-like protein
MSGHGSQPHKTNATAKITNALNKIITWHQKNYNENFQSEDNDLNNVMNKVIDPELVAMNQATLNITRLNAGNKHNVIPAKAEAILDCRLPHHIDSNEFIHTMKNLVDDDEIIFENLSTNEENLTLECEWDTELIHVMKEVLNSDYPNNVTIPLTSAYGTDNRFLRNIGINAYGFIPSIFSLEERSGFHNHDEYITKKNFINGCKMMYKITETLCSKNN